MAEQHYRAVVKHPLGGQYVLAHTVADTVSEARTVLGTIIQRTKGMSAYCDWLDEGRTIEWSVVSEAGQLVVYRAEGNA